MQMQYLWQSLVAVSQVGGQPARRFPQDSVGPFSGRHTQRRKGVVFLSCVVEPADASGPAMPMVLDDMTYMVSASRVSGCRSHCKNHFRLMPSGTKATWTGSFKSRHGAGLMVDGIPKAAQASDSRRSRDVLGEPKRKRIPRRPFRGRTEIEVYRFCHVAV